MDPRWTDTTEPKAAPKLVRRIKLELDGGLRICTDDEYSWRIIYLNVPSKIIEFPRDTPLEDIAEQLPARMLPVLRAAVADLERMVSEEVAHV